MSQTASNLIYNKNLALFPQLRNIFESDYKKTDYIIEDALNGEETMKIKDENGEYVYVHSKYEPSVIAKKQVENRVTDYGSYFVVAGVGLGYDLQAVIDYSKGDHQIVIYESNIDILKECISRVTFDKYKEDQVVFINDLDAFEVQIASLTSENGYKLEPVVVSNFGYEVIFKEQIDEVKIICQRIIVGKTLNDNIAIYVSDIWTNNIVKSQKYYYDSYPLASLFGGVLKDKPAIIVGGGPSLDKNVHLLKEVEGKYVIFSTHTAFKRLMKENIRPDFVVAVDGIQPVLDEYKETGFDVPYITCGVCNFEVLKYAKSEVFFTENSTNGFSMAINEKFDKEIPPIDTCGTVTGLILSLAVKAGCSPAIMIGQDLAYTNHKTHANGTIDGDKTVDITKYDPHRILVDDQNGGKIETSVLLTSYRDWFEHYMKHEFKGKDIINATEGGANIRGMRNMTLRDVIDTYETEENMKEIYQEILSKGKMFTPSEKVKIIDYLHEAKDALTELIPTIEQIVDVCNKLLNIYLNDKVVSNKKTGPLLKKYDKLELIINKNVEYLEFLGMYGRKTSLASEEAFNQYKDIEQKSIAKMSAYFADLLVNVKKIECALEICIKDNEGE